jgi:ribonuclease HI
MALDPRAPSRVRMPRCRICSAPMPAPRTAHCRLCAEIAHCSGVMIAYVDGSYFPQTRSAGAAAVILADDGSSRVVSGCVEASSSIEAEASAALLAVNTLESHEADSMVIFTDSLVLVRAMRSPSTPAVFRELRQTVYGRRVDWRFLPRGRRHPEHLAAHHEARRVASLSVVAPHRSSWTRARRLQSPESLFVVVAPYWSPERARAACCIAVADSCGVRCFVQPLSCSNRAEEENAAISSAIAMLPGLAPVTLFTPGGKRRRLSAAEPPPRALIWRPLSKIPCASPFKSLVPLIKQLARSCAEGPGTSLPQFGYAVALTPEGDNAPRSYSPAGARDAWEARF